MLRVFSAMDLVMDKLRNRVGEQLLYDCLVTFIEREVFMQVKDEALVSFPNHCRSIKSQGASGC